MTAHKHLKQLVRSRMKKTGESYASARRQIIRESHEPALDPARRWHFPGNVPAATALRVLLAHAGVRAPHTREPFSEAMLFGIAGGIGIGVFSFLYEKENFASFFIAGRHLWQDDLAYLKAAAGRLGAKPIVKESSGAKAAEKLLREALKLGPCIAWVDAAHLPHRAMPAEWSGGGYHVVTVYAIDDATGHALIGDLADEPVSIPLVDLAAARTRIQKQKNRLFSISPTPSPADLMPLVRQGLKACHDGLRAGGAGRVKTNFSLDAIRLWANRMHGSSDKESWERVFAGSRLWGGLTSIYDFIEHYGTGGGLCRPLFADFLSEAAEALTRPAWRSLAERYAELGRQWSALAHAALPDAVPLFREAKELLATKAELFHSRGADSIAPIRDAWTRLAELKRRASDKFPLSDAESAQLRADLKSQVRALYDGEVAALAALRDAID
jgi:hypothetical protein